MAYTFLDRLQHAWGVFTSRDPTEPYEAYAGSSYRPDRRRSWYTGDQSIVTTVKTRIAVDCAQINIRHVKKDKDGNFEKEMDSFLNKALATSANIDQTGRAFLEDLVYSMLDEGVAAAVPVETDISEVNPGQIDITKLRVGEVIRWYPKHVALDVYNEETGRKQQIVLPKSTVAIIENPFYSIMNEQNSTLNRLIRTLHNLDILNDDNVSGKLNMIIQMPYSMRTPSGQAQANRRLKSLENQIANSKYGTAYVDAAEKITQLNRPFDNNLWQEAQDLTAMLFNQLGLTQNVFDGTATESVMTNYYNRTVEPILTAIVEEMERKFLSDDARKKHQGIIYIRDPFKSVGITEIANMAKIFSETEIMASNELRGKIGLMPKDDPRADELLNKNINKVEPTGVPQDQQPSEKNQNEEDET